MSLDASNGRAEDADAGALLKDELEAYQASAERYRRLLEVSPDGILVADVEGLIQFANAQLALMLGYELAEELVGTDGFAIIAPEQRSVALERFRGLFETHITRNAQYTLVRRDGTRFPAEIQGVALTDHNGQQEGFLGLVRDITAETEAQTELERVTQRYAAAFNLARDGIVLTNDEGWYVDINDAAAAMLGYTREELLAMSPYDAIPAFSEEARERQKEFVRRGEPVRIAYTMQRKDGSRVDVEAVAVPNVEPGVHLAVRRDITEAKHLQKQIEEANERLYVAQRSLEARVRQATVVAEVSDLALAGGPLQKLLDVAADRIASTLDADLCQVLELQPETQRMLLRAGVGWQDRLVGKATFGARTDSQAGFTATTEGPVIVDDLPTETRFTPARLLLEHGVVSGVSVVIRGQQRPWGVIGAHTTTHRQFTEDDQNFLQAIANTLSAAIDRQSREELIRRLTAPVLPIADRKLLVPLVGEFDADRMQHLEDKLLNAIHEHRALTVVLDLTGAVPLTQAVTHMLRNAIEASRLLGAEVFVTGVSAELAGMLAREGIPQSAEMRLDLQSGIEAAVLSKRRVGESRSASGSLVAPRLSSSK